MTTKSYNQQAEACQQEGQYTQARYLLEQACRVNARDAANWFMLGAVNGQLGDIAAVISCCRKVLSLEPDNVGAWFNLAQGYMAQSNYLQAIEAYQTLLRLQPDHATALDNLGYAQQQIGAYSQAVISHQAALKYVPDNADMQNNLGNALSGAGKLEAAKHCYQRAIRIDPSNVRALNNLGGLYQKLKSYESALAVFDRALSIQPDYVEALINKGIVLQKSGLAETAHEFFVQACQLKPGYMRAISALSFNLNYFCCDPQLAFELSTRHTAVFDKGTKLSKRTGADGPRLRVGYVSADFRRHSVAWFFRGLLANHDRSEVEIFCYSSVERPDVMTQEIRSSAEHWRDISPLSVEASMTLIRDDGIDILVDLSGHTDPGVMEIFTTRLAPVQVTWLGYPNTTGLGTVDFRLTDNLADPGGMTDQYHSEQLVRLDDGFLCYQAPEDMPEVKALPAIAGGHITFASFNSLPKMNANVIRLWSRILRQLPGSRLMMKNASLACQATRKRYYRLFAEHGIDRDRLDLLGSLPRMEHYALYGKVDIALDTFPYHGTTTSCEALWMGVPIITLAGQMHAGRVGVSLLSQVGLQDWVADNENAYVTIAMKQASRIEALSTVRQNLRSRMAASSLCDGRAFAKKIEAAYRSMIRARS